MAQLIKGFAAKSNNLSSVPSAHTVEDILSALHMHMHATTHTKTHTHRKTHTHTR